MKKLLILAIVLSALLSLWQVSLVSGQDPDDCFETCVDLEKTGPETAGPGDPITYHFWVKNCGDLPLRAGAQVYDKLFGVEPIWDGVLQPGAVAEFSKCYTLPDVCGEFTNSARAVGHPRIPPNGPYLPDVYAYDSWTVEVLCPPGTGTPGYWMNNPWPVGSITIGGVEYSRDDAIGYMKDPVKGNKIYTMFPALVAAELNVFIGNDDSCIAVTMAAAHDWMATYGPVDVGFVEAGGEDSPWRDGEPLYEELDKYNNGELDCVSSRDDLE